MPLAVQPCHRPSVCLSTKRETSSLFAASTIAEAMFAALHYQYQILCYIILGHDKNNAHFMFEAREFLISMLSILNFLKK
jgi:hypothetical protein